MNNIVSLLREITKLDIPLREQIGNLKSVKISLDSNKIIGETSVKALSPKELEVGVEFFTLMLHLPGAMIPQFFRLSKLKAVIVERDGNFIIDRVSATPESPGVVKALTMNLKVEREVAEDILK